jgi:hypothetical protein
MRDREKPEHPDGEKEEKSNKHTEWLCANRAQEAKWGIIVGRVKLLMNWQQVWI